MIRDTQRSKVYAAEKVMEKFAKPLPTVQDVEKYVRYVLNLKRVRDAHPEARWWTGPVVKDGRGRRTACGGERSISIPLWARNTWIVVHELSHTIHLRGTGRKEAYHGWQYCKLYLKLVQYTHGKEAHDALKAAFKAAKVRTRAPRKGAPLSPERKAQLIQTLARAREERMAAKAAA